MGRRFRLETLGGPRLRLVTLNTWKGDGAYARRLTAMASGLAALSPDVVALQEALMAPEPGYDTAAHLATSLRMTAASLPLRRKSRMVEGRRVESTSGLAVLSRLPIRAQRHAPLTTDPRDGERAVLIVDIEAPGRTIAVACVHLTHLPDADGQRRRQWREVEAAVAGSAAAAIVAGDFNAPIGAFDLGSFADSRQACGEHETATLVEDPAACIDHVLFTNGRGLTATGWRTALGSPPPGCAAAPSDHLAVVADFNWV